MPMNYESLMQIALAEAAKSGTDVPVGAIILDEQHEIIAMAHNNREVTHDPTGHAEIIAIREATAKLKDWRLENCTLVVTLEPCVMCAGAIFWSNIGRVVYGIDAVRLRGFRGERLDQRDAELSCRDVFAASPHAIECIGPALVEEASAPHIGFWKV